MVKIFISYRREDSSSYAGRIYDRLWRVFKKKNVFFDVDTMFYGKDFRLKIRTSVDSCDVLLAVIGRQWATITDEHGERRLDNPDDFVRIEIESALQRPECLVIPVVVNGAKLPKHTSLPPSLQQLVFKEAAFIRDDPDFHRDMDKLIRRLKPKPNWWLVVFAVIILINRPVQTK